MSPPLHITANWKFRLLSLYIDDGSMFASDPTHGSAAGQAAAGFKLSWLPLGWLGMAWQLTPDKT